MPKIYFVILLPILCITTYGIGYMQGNSSAAFEVHEGDGVLSYRWPSDSGLAEMYQASQTSEDQDTWSLISWYERPFETTFFLSDSNHDKTWDSGNITIKPNTNNAYFLELAFVDHGKLGKTDGLIVNGSDKMLYKDRNCDGIFDEMFSRESGLAHVYSGGSWYRLTRRHPQEPERAYADVNGTEVELQFHLQTGWEIVGE